MKIGKVPENVLRRSVLKQIQTKRQEVLSGAGIGEDCAIFSFDGDPVMTCVQTAAVRLDGAAPGPGTAVPLSQLIQRCANNLAAAGARTAGVMIGLMLPEEIEEPGVRTFMEEAGIKCGELNIQIAGGQTCVNPAVNQPVAAVTGYGRPFGAEYDGADTGKEAENVNEPADGEKGGDRKIGGRRTAKGMPEPKRKYTDLDIVISKWIGLEGTAILAGHTREKLLQRYPAYFVEEAAAFDRLLSVVPEAATAVKSGVCMMHDASEGGIFGALWELAERAGVGLNIDLKKIPLRQETVEVCEYCNVNPYELLSGGALIMVTADGSGLAAALEAEKIPAAVVGRTTSGNDRIIVNGEETRYLDRPKNDEVYRWLTEAAG